ncbi:hypothetical protein [Nocardia callitridis]|uniref:Uncharacterized protein n=1 Tax=Nocardia callitridis TaxID=648753 RepID=A0ABP9KZL9_9NOCA
MFDRAKFAALAAVTPLVAGALLAAAGPAQAIDDPFVDWTPVDPAEYQVPEPENAGSVFFQTPYGQFCAIRFNNGPVGCDAVAADAPEGTNQVRATITDPAQFVTTSRPNFTHPEAKLLPEGHKITLENTICGVGFQGTVDCQVGEHGFVLSAQYSVLH